MRDVANYNLIEFLMKTYGHRSFQCVYQALSNCRLKMSHFATNIKQTSVMNIKQTCVMNIKQTAIMNMKIMNMKQTAIVNVKIMNIKRLPL